ncbi:hypothetical protein [Stenotrophomonas lactitubi]|uniref:hypothetical protein n=1 Tax=Stenotrophomonas lactitubi TaxID=2045214 RepID=UPI00320AA51E
MDPKRFEDLVRQLLYDFRDWLKLEPTGRSGSDDGFDSRGIERAPSTSSEDLAEEDLTISEYRTWLIQCKREKTISPSKLKGYLDGIFAGSGEPLHGLIFASACDFSKAARDMFNARCRSHGLREWYLFGKAELEDLLYRPQYDRLLFGYFGISLGRDSARGYTALRKALVGKRKAIRALKTGREVLVRSIADAYYPLPCVKSPSWARVKYVTHTHQGLIFDLYRHFAALRPEGRWDAAFAIDDANSETLEHYDNQEDGEKRGELWSFWNGLGDARAWLLYRGCVPYSSIVEVDADGDELAEFPHIYIEPSPEGKLFPLHGAVIEPAASYAMSSLRPANDEDGRVIIFPEMFRRIPMNYRRL